MAENDGEVLRALEVECDIQILEPPRVNGLPDEFVGKFAVALQDTLRADLPSVNAELAEAIEMKRKKKPFPARFAFNSLLRLVQCEELENAEYPYRTQAEWSERVRTLLEDDGNRKYILDSMQIWDVGSDVETRTAGPKLVAHLLQPDRVEDEDDPFTILNVGSARDHGLAMLSANACFPPVGALSSFDKGSNFASAIDLGARVNHALAQPIVLGDCYGVDIWPLRDSQWSRFLEACRFYPSELLDREKRSRYRRLEEVRDADLRLHHVTADFSDLQEQPCTANGFLEGLGSENQYDMVIFSTCMYQNYPDKRRIMMDNAVERLRAGGKIVVQDFCDQKAVRVGDPHVMDQLEFAGPQHGQSFAYKTFVYDPGDDENNFRPFISWNSGRCEALQATPWLTSLLRNAL